jgi:nitrogen regulatory protein PII-like uncharacterized protein
VNPQPVVITDLRATDNHFNLHRNGFQFLRYPGAEGVKYDTFEEEDKIKTKVYDEVKDLLKTAYVIRHIVDSN